MINSLINNKNIKNDFDYIDNWIYNHRINDDDKETLIRLNNIYAYICALRGKCNLEEETHKKLQTRDWHCKYYPCSYCHTFGGYSEDNCTICKRYFPQWLEKV